MMLADVAQVRGLGVRAGVPRAGPRVRDELGRPGALRERVLKKSPYEVPALRSALADGLVDGTTYHGGCGCLLTTLARARGLRYDQIPGLVPNSDRLSEQFFLKIKRGDTVQTNGFAFLADMWAEEFEKKVF